MGASVRRRKASNGDPRRFGSAGRIAGPGGPREKDAVVIDATDAVLLDSCEVSLIAVGRGGTLDEESSVFLALGGRINKTQDRATVGFLFDEDGAAAIVTELLALASRGGFGQRMMARVEERMERLHSEDAVRPVTEEES